MHIYPPTPKECSIKVFEESRFYKVKNVVSYSRMSYIMACISGVSYNFAFLISLVLISPFSMMNLKVYRFVYLFKEPAFSFTDLACCLLGLYFVYFCSGLNALLSFYQSGGIFILFSCFRCGVVHSRQSCSPFDPMDCSTIMLPCLTASELALNSCALEM